MPPGVALTPVATGLRSLPDPSRLPARVPQHLPRAPTGGRAGMEADGALDPVALERELRAAVEADERQERENDAKLRAVRQRVPSYEEFRSGGGLPGRGGWFGCCPTPKAPVNAITEALLGASCSCRRADPTSQEGLELFWSSFGSSELGDEVTQWVWAQTVLREVFCSR